MKEEKNNSKNQEIQNYWNNGFLMGSRELLLEIMGLKPSKEEMEITDAKSNIKNKWYEFILQGQIYISKLLKAENLSFLFGAGSSLSLGAITIRNIPLKLEYQILNSLKGQDTINLFYQILEYLLPQKTFSQININDRIKTIEKLLTEGNSNKINEIEIKVPLEDFLSFIYCLRRNLINPLKTQNNSESASLLSLKSGKKEIKVNLDILDKLIIAIKKEYFFTLSKVPDSTIVNPLSVHKQFLKKILTRPLNLRRPSIFTTNNDLIIDRSMDELGIMYLDGFIGTTRRTFRPESYNYDFYFPSTSTEGRVHRVDQVIHFYKIHGSINWVREFNYPENIYGIEIRDTRTIEKEDKYGDVMIYPTPLKNEFTLDFPYSDLFRRFSYAIAQPQSVLITIGYSFADEHVNRLIYQALTIPSFTLLIIDPEAVKNEEVKRLMALEDSRIYIISGWDIGTFEGFTKKLLPDIKELEIHEKSAKSARRMLRLEEIADDSSSFEEKD